MCACCICPYLYVYLFIYIYIPFIETTSNNIQPYIELLLPGISFGGVPVIRFSMLGDVSDLLQLQSGRKDEGVDGSPGAGDG